MGSDGRPDPNTIIDEGAPTSRGGMINAAALCNQIGVPFCVEAPRAQYIHGWCEQSADSKPIRCSSSTTMYAHDWHVTLVFDLVAGHSPLIVGMDERQYSDTCNRTWPRPITFKRQHDNRELKLFTYIADDSTGNRHLRLEIAPHVSTSVSTLMANESTHRELNVVKRVHKFGHATAAEMRELLSGTDLDKEKVK